MPRLRILLVTLVSLLLVPMLVFRIEASDPGEVEELGSSDAFGPLHPLFDAFPSDEFPPIPNVFPDALYSTGGTSLRNQSQGGILLSGNGRPPPPAIAAYAYWAVITAGPHTPNLHAVLNVQKRDPAKSKNVRLRGAVVGTGPDPCWPGDTITVFKAPIPLAVVNAGGGHAGAFDVRIICGGRAHASGRTPGGPSCPLRFGRAPRSWPYGHLPE